MYGWGDHLINNYYHSKCFLLNLRDARKATKVIPLTVIRGYGRISVNKGARAAEPLPNKLVSAKA
jgi:hypothetical protein